MQYLRHLVWLGTALFLSACSASGEDAAQQWVESRAPVALPEASASLPPIVDTPPAAYAAKTVVDPFSPSRIGQSRQNSDTPQSASGGRRYFSDVPVDSLRVVGFMEVLGQYVAVLEGSSGFVNAKVGDRLGNQQLEIIEISGKGIRLRQSDGSESLVAISRGSR